MKIKKPIALLLSLVSACSLFACGGGGANGKKLTLEVCGFDGGIGNEWLFAMEEEFEEKFANTQYGKYTGVNLEISQKQGLTDTNILADAYAVYFADRADIPLFAALGSAFDITDIVMEEDENGRTIDSLMTDHVKSRFLIDGKYYGLPHYESFGGVSYDVETFDKNLAYFADTTSGYNGPQDYNYYNTKFGTGVFIANEESTRSCGPDGVFDTFDDGLPTSLVEMLILCDYLKENGVSPFVLSGQWKNMEVVMSIGLFAALAGYDALQTCYSFDGEIEAIKLDANGNYIFTNEPLFPGVDGIYKPETEKVQITQANGHRTTDMVEKYYSFAFTQVAMQEGFFDSSSLVSTVSHTDAQSNVIFGSKAKGQNDKGMLIDSNFWWNESKMAGNFDAYALTTNSDQERIIRYMSLPTSLDTTTTEGNGEPITLLDGAHGNMYVNNNIKNKPELIAAVRDFIQLAYSDAKLREFTVITGMTRPLDYTLTEEDKTQLDGWGNHFLHLHEVGNVLNYGGDNDLVRKYYAAFRICMSALRWKNTWDGKAYSNAYQAIAAGSNARTVMETCRIKPDAWGEYYSE